jgi:D-alanyl-D-alanine carboxypeptidase/D-alanyl-D-alanine-endopeptidase (penicillin-binding protein 4)
MNSICRLRWCAALTSLVLFTQNIHGETLHLSSLIKNGSARVEQVDGTPLIRYRDEEKFVPASTVKIATAFCALESLGSEYRFETAFFADNKNNLFVRAGGDPSLVSETLESIARTISKRLPTISTITIDTSAFSDDIAIDGSAHSLNPYDAKNAAFVANFSSALVTHTRQGAIVSAEPQTPLTPRARQAGQRLQRGRTDRVSVSSSWEEGVLYGGELLSAFLRMHGASGEMLVRRGAIKPGARQILLHRSPQTLEEILRNMLKYSTNFTANQVFLTLGSSAFGAPATVQKAQRAMERCLREQVGWENVQIEEGSGLSRRTKVTALQMTQLLESFSRYSFLLPERDGFIAKTGTLRGVNSLAGYFSADGYRSPLRFVVLINSEVPHLHKYTVAKKLREHIESLEK